MMDTIRKLGITIGAIVGLGVMLGMIVCGQAVTIYVLSHGVTPSDVRREVQELRERIDERAGILAAETARCNEQLASLTGALDSATGWRGSISAKVDAAEDQRSEIRGLILELLKRSTPPPRTAKIGG